MIRTRKECIDLEERFLAPYAAHSDDSLGRVHPQRPHDIRPEFQRDRDRILHSRCFRRLEYKTQVFVNGTADHYRTRLTHTMEMAAVGRTLARALRANEDLTEAIALAHDIGHSPFGHSGERALDELMRDEGGFDHNVQSCRAVELIEQFYPGIPGLNLTWEVRAGLRKHQPVRPGAMLDGHPLGPHPMFEAQIADLADDLTYQAHDVDDGLQAGLITEEDLAGLEIWRRAVERARAEYPAATPGQVRRVSVRNLLDLQAEDVLRTTAAHLTEFRPASPRDVMTAPRRFVTFSRELRALIEPLREFLSNRVYFHPSVLGANAEAVLLMRRLFQHYTDHPEHMGHQARARIEAQGLKRTVCDYVAGCTDRYALEECHRFGLDQPEPGARA